MEKRAEKLKQRDQDRLKKEMEKKGVVDPGATLQEFYALKISEDTQKGISITLWKKYAHTSQTENPKVNPKQLNAVRLVTVHQFRRRK